tara:strand:- start:1366 stop:1686 length:321 start_codon:yes stop_codon:yes gene_type:complete
MNHSENIYESRMDTLYGLVTDVLAMMSGKGLGTWMKSEVTELLLLCVQVHTSISKSFTTGSSPTSSGRCSVFAAGNTEISLPFTDAPALLVPIRLTASDTRPSKDM